MTEWREFEWQRDEPDPRTERLCRAATGPIRLDCDIEGAEFTTDAADPKPELVVCAYNVERGVRLDDQLEAFDDDPEFPSPDVFLLSEADRGCSRSADRNIAREYARAKGMYYVFGVEFVELPRRGGPGGRIERRCEHGNAIVSRYPLGNVRVIRHQRARSWHSRVQRALQLGQPRLGGRVAVAADVRIGDSLLRLYSCHLESGRIGIGRWSRDGYRVAQASELIEDSHPVSHGVLLGGDLNVRHYLDVLHRMRDGEPTTSALVAAGFEDTHDALPASKRITTDTGLVIDAIFGRGVDVVEAGVGDRTRWGDLSDHLPIWARFRLERPTGTSQ